MATYLTKNKAGIINHVMYISETQCCQEIVTEVAELLLSLVLISKKRRGVLIFDGIISSDDGERF